MTDNDKSFEEKLNELRKLEKPFELPKRDGMSPTQMMALVVSICALAIAIIGLALRIGG